MPKTHTTVAGTTTDYVLLVEVSEETQQISFLDDDNYLVAQYRLSEFATVEDALAINLGRGMFLTAETVAQLQQFAEGI